MKPIGYVNSMSSAVRTFHPVRSRIAEIPIYDGREVDAVVAELVEALEPFALLSEFMVDDFGWSSDYTPMRERLVDWVGPSDLRNARTALARYRGEA